MKQLNDYFGKNKVERWQNTYMDTIHFGHMFWRAMPLTYGYGNYITVKIQTASISGI